MKHTKEMMLHHLTQWQQRGLNNRQYCTKVDLSYQALCKFCSRQNEPRGFTLIKPKNDKGVIKFHLRNGCYFSIPVDCSMQLLQKLISLC